MTMRIRKKPHKRPRATTAHLDRLLDEALRETFPASDPVAIAIDIGFSRHRTADAATRRGRKPGRYRPRDP